jgi:hypothetical protein
LDNADARLARKRRQAGRSGGLVEIPGPLPKGLEEEIRHLAARLGEEDARRRPGSAILAISPFSLGLAIETRGEGLAQRIANALRRSRHVSVERAFDDEGRRRILTCRLPRARARSRTGP